MLGHISMRNVLVYTIKYYKELLDSKKLPPLITPTATKQSLILHLDTYIFRQSKILTIIDRNVC